eukprot:gene4157-8263_t
MSNFVIGHNSPFLRPSSTLLVASTADVASINIASNLLKEAKWDNLDGTPSCYLDGIESAHRIRTCSGSQLFLWIQNSPLLHLDLVDKQFISRHAITENEIGDVIFLSKHCAASGTVSLTVHPIGIPWQIESSRSGGKPGFCSPPSLQIAALYRAIMRATKIHGHESDYQITLETTHHGPYVEIPTCFVEIGSTEQNWGLPHAGKVWATCLLNFFQTLPPCESNEGYVTIPNSVETEGIVVVGIGGGHYVPKLNDLSRLGEGVYIGHALATYTLDKYFPKNNGNDNDNDIIESKMSSEKSTNDVEVEGEEEEDASDVVPGGWQQIIREAIRSTRVSFPDQNMICLVDKKAFNSAGRTAITSFLNEQSIRWTYKSADIKKIRDASKSAKNGTGLDLYHIAATTTALRINSSSFDKERV